MSVGRRTLRFVEANGLPIFQQLCLEEALFRGQRDHWCVHFHGSQWMTHSEGVWEVRSRRKVRRLIVNHGERETEIVMGLGGKVDSVVNRELALEYVCT